VNDRTMWAAGLQDSLMWFLDRVVERGPLDPSAPVTDDVERLLRRFGLALQQFLGEDDGELAVIWTDAAIRCGVRLAPDLPEGARLSDEEIESRLRDAGDAASENDAHTYVPLSITWLRSAGVLTCVRIALRGPDGGPVLWIAAGPRSTGVAVWEWFGRYVTGLRSLFVTLSAVVQARAALHRSARRAELEGRVAALVHRRPRFMLERLLEASRVLGALAADDSQLDLAANAAISVLQGLCGSGHAREVWRRGRRDEDATEEFHRLREIDEHLRRILRRSPRACAPADARWRQQIACTSTCFGAILGLEPDPSVPDSLDRESSFPRDEGLDLLPMWTRVHERYRALTSPTVDDEDPRAAAEEWDRVASATVLAMAAFLDPERARRWHPLPEGGQPGSVPPTVRNWLALWFCTELLECERAAQLEAMTRSELRADLAYVLRESLRVACFGGRPDEARDCPSYVHAFTSLIVFHAESVARASGYGIRQLLKDIAASGGSRTTAAEHLQHLFEVYLAGHFILSLHLAGPADAPIPVAQGWTVGQALAAGDAPVCPTDAAVRVIEKAYSLAALFHDAGHVLFSSDVQLAEPLYRDRPAHQRLLSQLLDCLSKAGEDLSRQCLDDLGLIQNGVRAEPSYFSDDPLVGAQLKRWFDGEPTSRGPHHALLGAWYLHHVRSGAADRSHQLAVRAVLLHDVVGMPIDSRRDPVAALLILCNEIFDWDQGRCAEGAQATARRARSPDHWIRLPAVRIEPSATGGAPVLCLQLDPDQARAWPAVHMMLQPPHLLDGSVLRVWVTKAQSLGRIGGTTAGWSPTLTIRSSIGIGCHRSDGQWCSTRNLLLKAIARLERARNMDGLWHWLQDDSRFRLLDRRWGFFEEVVLGRLDTLLDRIPSQDLLALEAQAAKLLADFRRGHSAESAAEQRIRVWTGNGHET
jgi:hypothetical protein